VWLAVLDNISTVEKLGSGAPWQDTLDCSHTFIRSKSNQTSSCSGAMRNRQPGPSSVGWLAPNDGAPCIGCKRRATHRLTVNGEGNRWVSLRAAERDGDASANA